MNYRNTRFCENLNIMQFETEGEFDTPILKPYKYENVEFVGFNFAKSAKKKAEKGLHFLLTIISSKDCGVNPWRI